MFRDNSLYASTYLCETFLKFIGYPVYFERERIRVVSETIPFRKQLRVKLNNTRIKFSILTFYFTFHIY